MQWRSNSSSAKITAIRYTGSRTGFSEAVTLEESDSEAGAAEVVSVRSKWGTSGQQDSHPTSNACSHLGKYQLVHYWGGVAPAQPFQPVFITEGDQFGKERATVGNVCKNPLVDRLQDKRDKTHNGWLKHNGVPSGPFGHHSPGVGEGLCAAVTDGNAKHKHDVLSQKFKNMGKGKDGNVTVLTFVASVKDTADGGHDAEDGLDEVGVGHDDTFGNSGAAAGVHDDGRVRGVRWGFTLCRGRARRENGRELVEGDRLVVVRQNLRLVAEIMKVYFWYWLKVPITLCLVSAN